MARGSNSKLTLKILDLLAEGAYASKIAKRLKISRQSTGEKLARMERAGLLHKLEGKPIFYEITPQGKLFMLKTKEHVRYSSAPMKKKGRNVVSEPFVADKIEFHDFAVKIPIVEHGSLPHSKKVPLNNWIKEVLHKDFPIPLTISITTKSAILQYHRAELPRNSRFFSALFEWYVKGLIYAQHYLVEHGYRLRTIESKVISQHIAARAHEKIAEELPKEAVFSVKFNRKAVSASGFMAKNAEAWTDGTPDPRAIETNDLLYEEKLLLMPEKVDRLERIVPPLLERIGEEALKPLTEQIKLHLKVQRQTYKYLKAINEKLEEKKRMAGKRKKIKPRTDKWHQRYNKGEARPPPK